MVISAFNDLDNKSDEKRGAGIDGEASPARSQEKTARSQEKTASSQEDVTLGQMHGEFVRACRIGGLRETTLRTYQGSLRPWRAWCIAQGITLVGQIKTKDAEDYLLTLLDRKLSERTIRNLAIVIKAALKFAYKQGYLPSNRLYDWKIPRMARASVYMPDHTEVGIILSAIPQHWSAA